MIILRYESKKQLIEKVNAAKQENGKGLSRFDLRYSETSIFGDEVSNNCKVSGSNRPSQTRIMVTKFSKTGKMTRKLATEFYASLEIKDGYVVKVS